MTVRRNGRCRPGVQSDGRTRGLDISCSHTMSLVPCDVAHDCDTGRCDERYGVGAGGVRSRCSETVVMAGWVGLDRIGLDRHFGSVAGSTTHTERMGSS